MITVWGGQTSRSLRVVWLLEEMGLPYRVRQVDMLARYLERLVQPDAPRGVDFATLREHGYARDR